MAKTFRIVSKDNEGNEKVIYVKKPGHSELTDAQFYSSSIFNRAKNAGACLRSKLDEYLREQGLWTAEDQKKLEELQLNIETNIKILKTGKHLDGSKVKLSEGRKIAIESRRDRLHLNLLLAKKREHDAYTVEGQAENARFDYLVSTCVLDEDGNRVFADINDYYENQEEEYAVEAASRLASICFNLDEDWEKKLPENEFLIKHKLVDDELRYINRNGQYVNANYELVNKDGQRINEQGEVIDKDGQVVEELPEADFEDDLS